LTKKTESSAGPTNYGDVRGIPDELRYSSQPFALWHPDGRLIAFNNAFCELTGHTGEELSEAPWDVRLTPKEWGEKQPQKQEQDAPNNQMFQVLDELPAYVLLLTPDFQVRYANRCFSEVFGESGKRFCFEICHGQDMPCKGCPVLEVLKTKKPYNHEVAYKDRVFEVYHYPFYDTDGSALILVFGVDLTERKHFEKEMARLDRLNTIGEMAATIGHEVRGPLTTVRGFLQLITVKQDCCKCKDHLELMIQELDRANGIITEFLSLAKNKSAALKRQNLKTIVANLFPLLMAAATLSDKHIKLELNDVPDLFLDEKEIRQLVLNLAHNGLDAMSPRGALTITTFVEGYEVVLAVRDEGPGITPDLLDKIGTPFFTTKEKGTGLGLAVCYSITARHDAKIDITTGPDGTTFFVRFKITEW